MTATAGEFQPLPSGTYRCLVADGRLAESRRNQTASYKLTFEVLEPSKFAGRKIWHDLWMTAKVLSITNCDLAKLGITSPEQLNQPLPSGMIAEVRLTLRTEDDGQQYNRVVGFKVVGQGTPAGTLEDDDGTADGPSAWTPRRGHATTTDSIGRRGATLMTTPLGLRVVGGASNRRTVVSFGKALDTLRRRRPVGPTRTPRLPVRILIPEFVRHRQVEPGIGRRVRRAGRRPVPNLTSTAPTSMPPEGRPPAIAVPRRPLRRRAAGALLRREGIPRPSPIGGIVRRSTVTPSPRPWLSASPVRSASRSMRAYTTACGSGGGPNSRHHRTGCTRSGIDADDLLHISPIRSAPPPPSRFHTTCRCPLRGAAPADGGLVESASAVRTHQSRARPVGSDGPARSGRINPLTLTLLTDPTYRPGGRPAPDGLIRCRQPGRVPDDR